jgi:hypothetical protein
LSANLLGAVWNIPGTRPLLQQGWGFGHVRKKP